MTRILKFSLIALLSIFFVNFLFFSSANAQELVQDKIDIIRAKVLEISTQEKKEVPETGVSGIRQVLEVKILEGEKKVKWWLLRMILLN